MLEVKGIRVRYGKAEVLAGVSITADSGSMVALLGANGAGKTTTLRAISGLIRPSAGEIWFEGKRIDRLSPQDIVRLGIVHVPERRRLFPDMTVIENLYMGAFLTKSKNDIKKDLEEVCTLFPILRQRQHQAAGTLSGGEQQMLALGRGLMARPKIMLMDEPSLGLAPVIVKEVFRVIADIKVRRNFGVVLVEQNAKVALDLSDMAYVLENGTITLEGTRKELITMDRLKKVYLGGAA
ncbi:MAG: ABC transporter ATP-binding protein [Chloroflexi bacterium]|nr:ABC transporter ATP-binding protein [Chloroflexota bacterium]